MPNATIVVEKLTDDRPIRERVATILDQCGAQLSKLHLEVEGKTTLATVMAVCISEKGSEEYEWVYSANLTTNEALVELLAELVETITDPKETETVNHRLI